MPNININLGDCMEAMQTMKNKAYDLAIVDPPYGLGDRLIKGGLRLQNHTAIKLYKASSRWDIKPEDKYFHELFRVAQYCIIWGGNNFPLPPARGWLVWDKKQPWQSFSRVELAWTNLDKPVNLFEYAHFGAIGTDKDIKKFHPTAKPIALYKWLLSKYAKPGWKLLDTHGGSCSIAIAAHDLNYDIDIWELDPTYHKKALERLKIRQAQPDLIAHTTQHEEIIK